MYNITLNEFVLLMERLDLKLGTETTLEEIKAFYEEFSQYSRDQLSIAFAWYVKNIPYKPNVPRINNAIKMVVTELVGNPESIVKDILDVASRQMNYGTPAKTLKENYSNLHYEVFVAWKERIRNSKREYLENAMIKELSTYFKNQLAKSENIFNVMEIPQELIIQKKTFLLEQKREVRLLDNGI